MLKPAFGAQARLALDELARDTADGGPAMLVGAPWREPERGCLQRRVPAARRGHRRQDVQARAAELRRVRREAGVRAGPGRAEACSLRGRPARASWSARTSGRGRGRGPGRERGRDPARAQRLALRARQGGRAHAVAQGPGDRDRPAAGLRQPGGRPGRAGVRRRLVRAARPTAAGCQAADVRRGADALDLAAGPKTVWRCVRGRRSRHRARSSEAIYRAMVAGAARLRGQDRLPGRGAGHVGRHRFGAHRRGRGGRAGRRAGALRDAAVALHRAGQPRGRRRAAPTAGHAPGQQIAIEPAVEAFAADAGAAVRRPGAPTPPRRTSRRASAA